VGDVFDVGDVHVWRVGGQLLGYLYFQTMGHDSMKFPGRVDVAFNDWVLSFDEKGSSDSTETLLATQSITLDDSAYRLLSMRDPDGEFHREWAIVLGPINVSDFKSKPQSGIGTLGIVYTNTRENYSVDHSGALFLLLEDDAYPKKDNLLSTLILEDRDPLAYEVLTNELKGENV